MSRLVTQLVIDEPAIVLVGEQTLLSEKLAAVLIEKKIRVVFLLPEQLNQNINLLQEAYKIVWIGNSSLSSTQYLPTLQILSQFSIKTIVIIPVFTGAKLVQSDLLQRWVQDTNKQDQFIVDCNYYLSSSSFIFGKDIIDNTTDLSICKYIFLPNNKNIFIDPKLEVSLLMIDEFVFYAKELLFIPQRQLSTLITGSLQESTTFVSLVKKLYESYHSLSLELFFENVELNKLIPFSVTHKMVATDYRAIATHIVKTLPLVKSFEPSKLEEEIKLIPLPTQPVQNEQRVPSYNSKTANPTYSQVDVITQLPQVDSKKIVKLEPELVPEFELKPEPKLEHEPVSLIKNDTPESSKYDDIDFNKEIQKIFKDTRTEKKVERVEKLVKSTKKIDGKSKRKTKLFYGGLLTIGMACGMLILASIYLISGSLLKNQVSGFLTEASEKHDFSIGPDITALKTAEFVAAQTSLYGQILELNLISQNLVTVNLIQEFKDLPFVLADADKATKNLVINIVTGNVGNTAELTETLTHKASEAYEKLSLIQATMQQIDLGDNSQKQQSIVDQIEVKIKEIRAGLEIHQEISQVLQNIVGVSEKRTYALLLQNNQELRPTGGFIQAVALLNFDNGSLVSYQVYSVYDLDKRLSGQVVPPEEISTYLGETNWYLRDANWDPDFAKTSKQITWFIERSLGVSVDGVISMNVFSLAELVKAVGPIDLPEHNEVITEKNLEERMEFHSEVVLIDSPETVDYSVSLLKKTLEALSALKEESVPTLLSGLHISLDTKQTQIYSKFESEQSILQTLGWTGVLAKPSCPSRLSIVECMVDTMTQVEANIGINKANYYINRTINHSIAVSKSSAQHTRTILFENKAQSNSWPKGTYKSYIRFYINPESIVEKVTINGQELTDKQIVKYQNDGFGVIGIRVDVPIQKQVALELKYSTPLGSQDSFSYVFYNRKQSGLDADDFTVSINFTPELKPILVAPNASISGNTITFSANTLDDASLFGVQFE